MRSTTRVLTLLAAAPLAIVSCSSSAPDATSAPTTTIGPVAVTSDLRFADAAPTITTWSDPLLDVYAPQGAAGVPLVVVLPPHGLVKDNAATVQLARAVAERGAVAVVANWTQLDDPPATFEDPAALAEITAAGQSFAGCAVSFAVAHAGEYGADPTRLTIVGELFGANTASMIALGSPSAYAGCGERATWSASALVGINDDWLATVPFFDPVVAAAVETLSPWALLGRAPKISTKLVVTAAAPGLTERCGERDADWMVARDPSGAMRARLDAVGAYQDGCLDLGDEAAAMAAEMSAHGLAADVVQLPNTDGVTRSDDGAHVLVFGPTDLAVLVDAVMDAAATGTSASS